VSTVKIIEELATAFGVSGFELNAIDVAMRYIPDSFKVVQDDLLNLYIYRANANPDFNKRPKILISAQIDEAGLIVSNAQENGMISFECLGKWLPSSLYSMKVNIENLDGNFVTGIITAHSSHFDENKKTPDIEKMYIDVGASTKEAVYQKYKIAPNCPIIPSTQFEQEDDVIISKALNSRLGCSALLELLRKINDESFPVEILGLISCQSESETQFSSSILNKMQPDLIILLDSIPADDMYEGSGIDEIKIKSGPVLRQMYNGVPASSQLCDYVLNKSKQHEIPIQSDFNSSISTDKYNDFMLDLPVPYIALSCPVRSFYGHSNIASMLDYNRLVSMMLIILESLTSDKISAFQ